jgi:hypothetical protein
VFLREAETTKPWKNQGFLGLAGSGFEPLIRVLQIYQAIKHAKARARFARLGLDSCNVLHAEHCRGKPSIAVQIAVNRQIVSEDGLLLSIKNHEFG